jgi:hypothetical protein
VGRQATLGRLRQLAAKLLTLLVAGVFAGCAVQTVRQQSYPQLRQETVTIDRVAVAPLAMGGDLAARARRAEMEAGVSVGSPPKETGVPPEEATALVARYLSEALAHEGLDVTTQDDVGRALAEAGLGGDASPREVARLAHDRFGAEGIVMGRVSRYRERTGGAQASGAASVWFEVSLYSAPDGDKLWSGVFNETQQPLSYNVFSPSRYPGGGTRWLSVDELARWGAEQTAAAMPVGAAAGSGPQP